MGGSLKSCPTSARPVQLRQNWPPRGAAAPRWNMFQKHALVGPARYTFLLLDLLFQSAMLANVIKASK